MKIKILKEFYDKNTNELYKIGDEIQVNKTRGEELLASKLELVSEIKVNKKKSGD